MAIGICNKGVGSSSIFCKHWVNRKFSGIVGRLKPDTCSIDSAGKNFGELLFLARHGQ